MKMPIKSTSVFRAAVITVGATLLTGCFMTGKATKPSADNEKLKQSSVAASTAAQAPKREENISAAIAQAQQREENPPDMLFAQEEKDRTVLNRRLQMAKKNLGAYLAFADDFRKNRQSAALADLQKPAEVYMKKHVESLLSQKSEGAPQETIKITAEVMIIKARLLLCLEHPEEARIVVADMKKRFAALEKTPVEILGKTTTIDAGIRSLSDELAITTSPAKK